MQRSPFVNALPIVASVLGRRYGVEVVVGGERACTDGRVIRLPSIDSHDPGAYALARGYLDHEAAHVRYTDFSAERGATPLARYLHALIEDLRIEDRMARAYPGCRDNLEGVDEALKSDARAGLYQPIDRSAHPANVLGHLVQHVGRVEHLRFHTLDDLAANARETAQAVFGSTLADRLERELLDGLARLSSTREAAELADHLVASLAADAQSSDGDAGASAGDGAQGSGGDNASPSPGSVRSDDDRSDEQATGRDSARDGADGGSRAAIGSRADGGRGSSPSPSAGITGTTPEATSTPEPPDPAPSSNASHGEASNPQAASAAVSVAGGELDSDRDSLLADRVRAKRDPQAAETLPRARPVAIGREPLEAGEVRRASAKLRQRLAGALQAVQLDNELPSTQGPRLSARSLHRLASGDPRICHRPWPRQAVHTAVQILADQSASTRNNDVGNTVCRATLALMEALARVNDVAAGAAMFPYGDDDTLGVYTRIDERLGHTRSRYVPWPNGRSTPMAGALWWAAGELARRREARRIVVVITDGAPNSREATKRVIERMEAAGIEVLGLGIQRMAETTLFRDWRRIDAIDELAAKLFELVQTRLAAWQVA